MCTRNVIPVALLATLLTAALLLACRLTVSEAAATSGEGDAALENLLGGSRMFAGGVCFSRADLYLHRGLGHQAPAGFTNRWFQRLGEQISPGGVVHREGVAGMREVLPWVGLAARFDPTNTDYVLTEAYLLRVAGEPDRALRVLRSARAARPSDPELSLEEARLMIQIGSAPQAAPLLDACRRLIEPQPTNADLRAILAEADLLRGLLYECDAATNRAAALLSDAAALEPRLFGTFSNRADALRAGRTPDVSSQTLLKRYRDATRHNPLCAHDEHDDGDHDEHAH